MNYKCKIAICLFSAASFFLHADDGASLPAITANGIMNAGQTEQVLFKVTDKKTSAGQSYILNEGDERAGIKVVAIDAVAGVVTFDNHGTVQKIALAKPVFTASANPASAPAPVTPLPTPVVNAPTPAPRISQSAARGANVVVIGNRSNNRGRKSINGIAAQTGNGGDINNNGANNFNPNHSRLPGNTAVNASQPTPPTPLQSSPVTTTLPSPIRTTTSSAAQVMSVGAGNQMAGSHPVSSPQIAPP